MFLDVFRYALQVGEIEALYTYHNGEDWFNENNIVALAREMKIPVHYEVPTAEDMQAWLDKGVGLFLVAEYSSKLPIPDDPRFRGINFHSSLLPEGRSYYPIEYAMWQKIGYVGITAHKLFASLDSGDIIAQAKIPISQDDDSVDAYIYCAAAALDMARYIFTDFDKAWADAQKQTAKLPYWRRPDTEAMTLNHGMTKAEAQAVYRCFNKMTEAEIGGKTYFVDSFAVGNADIGSGRTVFVRDNRVLYALRDGHLRLDLSEK